MNDMPHFQCPTCGAEHRRGFVDGISLFRCLGCGYQGHGFSADRDIDAAIYADHLAANAHLRSSGLEEVPLGRDPKDFAS